ncbi:unnamed protein product [Dracunculus medinensis]|uniref:Probable RNA-binding protein EIF1AD n=1 Tax=Dracunculus medinensis TaxID=318479 RepID=A0A0N4U8V2_DRAME|nr:unnamed protein product [Dracunculus medinensis]
MSNVRKRRIVQREAKTIMVLPKKDDIIAKITASRGNNLHSVDSCGESYLVSMPTKFRKSIWVKRGNFVVISTIQEGNKVKGEIVHILDNENILYIYEQNLWPQRFLEDAEKLTRAFRRNVPVSSNKKHEMIDADMLPPSDSEVESEGEEYECDDESEEEIITYNPNLSDIRRL